MTTSSNNINRGLIALALGLALLTIVPVASSFVAVPEALSTSVDTAYPLGRGGVSTHYKNSATPTWMAELLERNRASLSANADTVRTTGYSI